MRDHLERNELIKNFVKTKREEVIESDDKVMLHVDWAENGTIIVPNEIQTAFYGGRTNYSIHSGYQYAKENSGGFVSLSDDPNHRAEAIKAALDPKVKHLVENGFKEIIFVSDSPISQYRNGKAAYLTNLWSKNYGIKIMWIFTESGHGKSSADGINGRIKNLVRDKVLMNPDLVLNNVEAIKGAIETSIEIFIHTKEDIKRVQQAMPKIGQLTGAIKLHLLVFEDRNIKKKDLPNEISWKPIRIKIGREIVRTREEVEGADVLNDAVLEPDSDDEDI